MKLILTPHGSRFGDAVKRELANPDSELAQITRRFLAIKKLCDSGNAELELGVFGLRFKEEGDECFRDVTPFTGMSIWYKPLPKDF